MKHHNHFSAFMAVGKRYSLDIKLHGIGITLAALQIETDSLNEFVSEFDSIIDRFIDTISTHGYPDVCSALKSCNMYTEYHDIEVFTNLCDIVRKLNSRI